MNTTENAIAALKADLEGLNAQIAEQKDRHKSERDGLRLQRAPLARAIRALAGGGKPMSAEAKAAIKAGLEKARAAKLTATNGTASVPAQQIAAKPVPDSTLQPAKKEPQRAN